FQHDDRDHTLCLLRVVAKGREIVAVSRVEAIALRSLGDWRRTHLELLGADLDLGLPVLHQVVVPAGVCRRAALRCGDDEAVAVSVVNERRRAYLSALGPAMRQQ